MKWEAYFGTRKKILNRKISKVYQPKEQSRDMVKHQKIDQITKGTKNLPICRIWSWKIIGLDGFFIPWFVSLIDLYYLMEFKIMKREDPEL